MSEKLSFQMTAQERGISVRLASLFSLRMFGIFIILPVFSLYAQELEHRTPFLSGLLFASYALTQIILQPLFGILSDRFGRKKTIIIGLILFTLGSVIVAFSEDIYTAIFGRIIQGAGAISAVVLALAADLTRDAIRTKVMAIIGISIGISFGIAMFIAPLIYHYLFGGVAIFLLCALLSIAGIYVTIFHIPEVAAAEQHVDHHSFIDAIRLSFKDQNICRLYFGGLMIHLILTQLFMAFPYFLEYSGYDTKSSWFIYLPGFFISMVLMVPLVGVAERFYQHRGLFLVAIFILGLSVVLMLLDLNGLFLLVAMILFFLGFNILEAVQPSLMSRFAPNNNRGMIMGIFSSSQFLGASIGGMIGNLLVGYFTYKINFVCTIGFIIIWFMIAWPMDNPVRDRIENDKRV